MNATTNNDQNVELLDKALPIKVLDLDEQDLPSLDEEGDLDSPSELEEQPEPAKSIGSSIQAFSEFTEKYLIDMIKDYESIPDDLLSQLETLYINSSANKKTFSVIDRAATKILFVENNVASKFVKELYRNAVNKMNMSPVYKFNHPRVLLKILLSDLCTVKQYTDILKFFVVTKHTNYRDSAYVINNFVICCNCYFIIKQLKTHITDYVPSVEMKPLVAKLEAIFE
jgi:hypothetical protein